MTHINPDDEEQANLIFKRLKSPKPKIKEYQFWGPAQTEGRVIRFLDNELYMHYHEYTKYKDTK